MKTIDIFNNELWMEASNAWIDSSVFTAEELDSLKRGSILVLPDHRFNELVEVNQPLQYVYQIFLCADGTIGFQQSWDKHYQ